MDFNTSKLRQLILWLFHMQRSSRFDAFKIGFGLFWAQNMSMICIITPVLQNNGSCKFPICVNGTINE